MTGSNETLASGPTLLDIRDLRVSFFTRRGVVKAIDGVSLSVRQGGITGLVGETGSGKTVTGLALIGLIRYPGRILGGQVWFGGEEWLSKPPKAQRKIRGKKIAMIFQNAKSSLNPLLRVEEQVSRAFWLHHPEDRQQALPMTLDLLHALGLPDPRRVMRSYPHELSGGMAQRVVIATALACRPALLIADEPSTALDVTIQAEILRLMRQLRDELNTSILLITHDLGVVAETCDRVAVMHAGHLVEEGSVHQIFTEPMHPYTRALISSIPRVDRRAELAVIMGSVPDLIHPPPGCRFIERCPSSMTRCVERPPHYELEGNRRVMCFLYEK